MKKIYIILAITCFMLQACVSMDMSPSSQGSSESWYSSELQLQMACNRLYTIDYWNMKEESERWTDNFTYRLQNMPSPGCPLDGSMDGYNSLVTSMWTGCYDLIAQANLIIKYSYRALDNGVGESVVDAFNAEAYFARACKYAELIGYFGAVPYMEGEMTITEAEAMGRTPLEELIPLVYADFDRAIDGLPATYTGTQRFTKGAAMAMKARFALYQGDWATAAESAKNCMDLGIYSLESEYSDIFLQNTKEIPEKVFILPRSIALGVSSSNDSMLNWVREYEPPRVVGGWGSSCPSWDLFASYLCTDGLPIDESPLFDPKNPFENRDPRCAKTIVEFGTAHMGWYFEPYNVTITNVATGATQENPDCRLNQQYSSYNGLLWKKGIDDSWLDSNGNLVAALERDYIIMRYADVLLMYAEAKIEMNSIDDSVLEAINSVRARAYGVDVSATSDYPAVTTTSQSELRRILRLERRIEFANEDLRYMDVVRWGLYDKAFNGYNFILPDNDAIENMINNDLWFWGDVVPQIDEDGIADLEPLVTAGLATYGALRFFPDHQALWPIPSYDILLCPNLVQNPGY